MKNKFGFTLAEILVTMGIIGVVSALTVPNLVSDYQKKAQALMFRKTIVDLETQLDLLITEEGKTKLSATSFEGDISGFMDSHFKIINTCGTNSTECFAASYLPIFGSTATNYSCGKAYILASSAAVCITKQDNGDFLLNVDTNGPDDPNIGGRDMFTAYIYPDGKVYYKPSSGVSLFICTASALGKGCLHNLELHNWKMEY